MSYGPLLERTLFAPILHGDTDGSGKHHAYSTITLLFMKDGRRH
jgi:hypothetical protein